MNANLDLALKNLIAASGGRVWIVSGDRDAATQKRLWDAAVKREGSEKKALQWVARPGTSNHEKGGAVDLGGDLTLAARLAPRFGLHRPMQWEPWHFEVAGETHNDDAYTTGPNGETVAPPAPTDPAATERPDYAAVLNQMVGMPSPDEFFSPAAYSYEMPEIVGTDSIDNMALPNPPDGPIATSRTGGPDGIDAMMNAIRAQESGGDYKAMGATTKWGKATGGYQFLDTTWGNYRGYARAADAPPEVQDARARELMQRYYAKFGNWADVAAAWFSGPGGKFSSPEVRKYVGEVLARVK